MIKNKVVVFFDSDCLLCNSVVNWLLKFDKRNVLLFAAIGSELFKELSRNYFINKKVPDAIMCLCNNKLYIKSSAVIMLLYKMGGFFRISLLLCVIPRFIRDAVYNLIAKYRNSFNVNKKCVV